MLKENTAILKSQSKRTLSVSQLIHATLPFKAVANFHKSEPQGAFFLFKHNIYYYC